MLWRIFSDNENLLFDWLKTLIGWKYSLEHIIKPLHRWFHQPAIIPAHSPDSYGVNRLTVQQRQVLRVHQLQRSFVKVHEKVLTLLRFGVSLNVSLIFGYFESLCIYGNSSNAKRLLENLEILIFFISYFTSNVKNRYFPLEPLKILIFTMNYWFSIA